MQITSKNHRFWVGNIEINLYLQLDGLWWWDVKDWTGNFYSYHCQISPAKFKDWETAMDDALECVGNIIKATLWSMDNE